MWFGGDAGKAVPSSPPTYSYTPSSSSSSSFFFFSSLSLKLFPSSLIIAAVEAQRPQLSVQSPALITLFHDSSWKKPGSSSDDHSENLPFIHSSQSILSHCKPFLSYPRLHKPRLTPSLRDVKQDQSQMPWTFAWRETTPHSPSPGWP